jgi:hypothetical protein
MAKKQSTTSEKPYCPNCFGNGSETCPCCKGNMTVTRKIYDEWVEEHYPQPATASVK